MYHNPQTHMSQSPHRGYAPHLSSLHLATHDFHGRPCIYIGTGMSAHELVLHLETKLLQTVILDQVRELRDKDNTVTVDDLYFQRHIFAYCV